MSNFETLHPSLRQNSDSAAESGQFAKHSSNNTYLEKLDIANRPEWSNLVHYHGRQFQTRLSKSICVLGYTHTQICINKQFYVGGLADYVFMLNVPASVKHDRHPSFSSK